MHKKNSIIPFLLTILVTSTLVVLNQFLSYKEYTLYENRHWESGKTKLKKGVVATWCMVFTKAGVSGNKLNISAWQGYQEFIYYKPFSQINNVQFLCKSANRPFAYFINKSDSISHGIYFNYRDDSISCFFTCNKGGKFTSKQDFSIGSALKNKEWNQIKIETRKNCVNLSINNRFLNKWDATLPDSTKIGFRGSSDNVYIDDIYISGKTNIVESFSPPFILHWQTFIVFFFLLLLLIVFPSNKLLISSISLLTISFIYAIYFWILSSRYPHSDNYIDFKGVSSNIESEQDVCTRLSKEYQYNSTANKRKVILFIGSSQTWGAGISENGKTIPEIIQDTLRTRFNDTSILVVNCGISGSTSDKLLSIYKNEWIRYKPMLTIINLSTNDYDTIVFRKSLMQFVELNKSRRIKTLFLAEPNDLFHTPRLADNHRIMNNIARQENGVQVVNIQQYMDSCQTLGFIWWDYVHLTDYGYILIANKIKDPIIQQYSISSLKKYSSF